MAQGTFDSFRDRVMGNATAIDLDGDDIMIILTDDAVDTPVLATDQDIADLAGAEIGTRTSLASKTLAAGVFDAANTTMSTVSGASAEHLVMFDNTPAADADKDLIMALDNTTTGLPITPNGGDIQITWGAYILRWIN